MDLHEGWQLKACCLVPESAEVVSTAKFKPRQWHPVSVPCTVLHALIKNGVYPDLRIGTNAYLIPDSSYEFNRKHDLAKYSYLPDKRNPWREPYWYRREFELPNFPSGRHVWLHFDAINYRAEVWLNGRQIADTNEMAGMFRRFQFDISGQIQKGRNVLALKIFPVDHPGLPDLQLEVLGKDRGYVGRELMKDVTEIVTIGYDCMMTVPDRNMGIWQPVWIDWTGPVAIRNPFIVTDLPLPETNRATLRISAELVNASREPVRGVLRGQVIGTEVRFEQAVAVEPGEKKIESAAAGHSRAPMNAASGHSRAPPKLVKIDPAPVLKNPRLWWPVNYGEQHRYQLVLQFETETNAGAPKPAARPPNAPVNLSDEQRVGFGVRSVGYEMHELDGWHGRRLLINGQKIFCRGGYIQPELIFDWDARRMETELRYYAGANLNLIYFEDIPNPPEPFLELCDRYGVLFGSCHYSCYWLRPGTPFPEDFPLLEKCTGDVIKRNRNHPSLVMYMAMNESDTKEDVYEMWRRQVIGLDGTRWFIPSASFPSGRKDTPDWFKKDLPAGMTDIGASYSWAEPAQYFRWVREKKNWMFMMESGSASLPPISSLTRFLPEINQPESPARGPKYPLNADWAHHGANNYFKGYDAALRRLHGEPERVADYCWKGHLVTADQHRAMYEAANHRLWDITSGFTEWKINACEPSVQWQIFDWYLKPMVSWYYIKKACEPLHVQFNLPDRMVSVINTRLAPQAGLMVRAQVFDLDSRPVWEKSAKMDAPANGYRETFAIPETPGATPACFIKLTLHDGNGRAVSDNFYWLPGPKGADYKPFQSLPPVKVTATWQKMELSWGESNSFARVTIRNPGDRIAFFVQLAFSDKNGAEILPVWWEDNYLSLLPGESREISARFCNLEPLKRIAKLELGGWNVERPCRCTALQLSKKEVKSGEALTITAKIADTFLDGSRVWLYADGKPIAAKWAWARQGQNQMLNFVHKFDVSGKKEISIGNKRVYVSVSN